ncbi:MAG: nuclear transport factor 2 family protein [Lachnospiraceae bacterium]|nr:nuclear transport factor 2 family protein [Lachnospiraceae bacterium]
MNIYDFWKDILGQNANAIRGYFDKDAYINWHCTNEHFNVDEFIVANCEYPGDWNGEVERVEKTNDVFITVTHVYSKDKALSFHVTSFIKVVGDKIVSVDEYWADDGDVPNWRLAKNIGKAIK